jgi:AcrR family transcriptional regulator
MAEQALQIRPDTRTRLLRAAEWVIVHEGVHALTIRRVAAEAGANSALIGYHFGSVGGLLAELARLNAEPILTGQREGFERAVAGGGGLDDLLDAFLRPLWSGAALNPDERALVVVDEIVTRAEPQLREEVWAWFAETAGPFYGPLADLLPELGPDMLRWRLRFLSASALDLPPRGTRSALAPLEDALTAAGENERYRQFLAFARASLSA